MQEVRAATTERSIPTGVAKVSDVSLKTSQERVTLAEFRLAAGAWLIQAKAIAKATGGVFDPEYPNKEAAVTTKRLFKPIANRLLRSTTLPKWSLTIHPQAR